MSLNAKRLVVSSMETNCYLVYDLTSLEAIIIDPGDSADFIERVISDLNLLPVGIAATHGHFDHCMAIMELKLAYDIPFFMNPLDSFLLERQSATSKHFIKVNSLPAPKIDRPIKDGDKVNIGKYHLNVIQSPGHTPGSICLYTEQDKICFVGDLIFEDDQVGRTDFGYSDRKQLEKSIYRLKSIARDFLIYPGHGEPFRL